MGMMKTPPSYTRAELAEQATRARAELKSSRRAEERLWADFYHAEFEAAYKSAEDVLARTDFLRDLGSEGSAMLKEGLLSILRTMDRPTVSEDDFKTLSGTRTTAARTLAKPEMSEAAMEYIERNLNTDIFPWIANGDAGAPSEADQLAAKRAVAALVAESKTKTAMRNRKSKSQESEVRDAIIKMCGFKEVAFQGELDYLANGPSRGEVFDRETVVGGRKADVVAGIWDGRCLCIECKVSNSEVNSFKRLNHETIEKAETWAKLFGAQCVTCAVLSGVFKADNLMSAQERGVYIFWSHDLEALATFINETKD